MESYAAASQVYAAGLIFARVGAIVMLLPGFGDTSVPPRIRLSFAFLMALMLMPVVAKGMPVPGDVSGVAGAVIKELMIGLMIGAILRMLLSSLATAGEIISIQTTLSFAQTAAPGQAQPSTTLGTFLGLIGITLIMATDLHHMFLAAIVKSYSIFPFSRPIQISDGAQLAIQTVAGSFRLGLQLAAPVVVLLPVEVDRPLLAAFSKPALVTVAVSPGRPSTHCLASTSVAWWRVLVWVQLIAVSLAPMVKVLPLSATLLPVQARVAV